MGRAKLIEQANEAELWVYTEAIRERKLSDGRARLFF
jgi:hypothetical protein